MKCPKCGKKNDVSNEIDYPFNKLPFEVQEAIKNGSEEGMGHRMFMCPSCEQPYIIMEKK